MAVVVMKNGGASFGIPIYQGTTKGQDTFQSIGTSYTAKKGDIVFMWRYSTDSQCQAYKNSQILSLNQVNKFNGSITAFVGVFLAENGDVFRFDNATSTQNHGANACGIAIMPIK